MFFEGSRDMMDGLRDYVLHIAATALICAVILRFARGGKAAQMLIKLLCGIVLAYSIIHPVKQLEISGLDEIMFGFQKEAEAAVEWGKNEAYEAWTESITQKTEAYILEKAKAMKLDLAVEVELSDDESPVPVAVSLYGDVAPYAKSVLSDTISQDLKIPKEKLIWISQ
jgi:hypothetical protein